MVSHKTKSLVYPPGDKYDVNRNTLNAFSTDAINLNQNYVNGTAEDR